MNPYQVVAFLVQAIVFLVVPLWVIWMFHREKGKFGYLDLLLWVIVVSPFFALCISAALAKQSAMGVALSMGPPVWGYSGLCIMLKNKTDGLGGATRLVWNLIAVLIPALATTLVIGVV